MATARRRSTAASKRGGVAKKRPTTPRRDADSQAHDPIEDAEMLEATNSMSSLSSEVTSQVSLSRNVLQCLTLVIR